MLNATDGNYHIDLYVLGVVDGMTTIVMYKIVIRVPQRLIVKTQVLLTIPFPTDRRWE